MRLIQKAFIVLTFVFACAFTTPNYSTDDVYYLSRTMWAEARGEGSNGMLQVGSVVINRVHDKRYPKTIKAVVLQPKQFTVWQPRNPNYKPMLSVTLSDPRYVEATRLAKQLLESGSVNKFTRFEVKNLSTGGTVIGNHRFR